MSAIEVIGSQDVDVAAVDKTLAGIWKSLAPLTSDEVSPVMQASVVNLVAVAPDSAAADAITEVLQRLMLKAPCRFVVLDSQPDADPPSLEASVSVWRETQGSSHTCCEQIRVSAKGISADVLPAVTESFYAPDLPIVVWWASPLTRPDFGQFAVPADRMMIDSLNFDRAELKRAALLIEPSRQTRTAISDLNWARLTPYRQLFAQFFDAPDSLAKLQTVETVAIEAQESAALLLSGWLFSRLNRPPMALTRAQVTLKVTNDESPVFRSMAMKCGGGVFTVRRTTSEVVEAQMTVDSESGSRTARIPVPSLEKLLSDEIGRSGRDRAYDAAVCAAVEI